MLCRFRLLLDKVRTLDIHEDGVGGGGAVHAALGAEGILTSTCDESVAFDIHV